MFSKIIEMLLQILVLCQKIVNFHTVLNGKLAILHNVCGNLWLFVGENLVVFEVWGEFPEGEFPWAATKNYPIHLWKNFKVATKEKLPCYGATDHFKFLLEPYFIITLKALCDSLNGITTLQRECNTANFLVIASDHWHNHWYCSFVWELGAIIWKFEIYFVCTVHLAFMHIYISKKVV